MAMTSEREWLSVKEFAERNPRLSRNFVYELCKAKKLKSIKAGGKVLVASDALDALAQERSEVAEVA